MLVNADVKGLEWRVAMFYCQDPVGIDEILNNAQIHDENKKYFGFKEKVHAKAFLFRLVYGGTKNGFAKDPSMGNSDPEFWQGIIEKTYEKYKRLGEWHRSIKAEARRKGRLISPSGREYRFTKSTNKFGKEQWNDGEILNWPVQGFGADIVKVIRLYLKRYLPLCDEVLLINTVHDSIMVDCTNRFTDEVCRGFIALANDLPGLISKLYNIDYNIPMELEVETGSSWGEMGEWKDK